MSLLRTGGVLLALALAGAPQDLAPEVLLLARVKSQLREELARLPNYTCLETISRFHKDAARSAFNPLDTVRLEIVYSDHREWYGSPGDRNLGVSNPAGFVGSGLIGSGVFATALINILNGGHFVYKGNESVAGRSAVKFDFQFPNQLGAFNISMTGGSGSVGEKGSLWFDEKSLDLIRLESHADEIPPWLPMAEQNSTVNYARAQIGNSNALLSQQADVELIRTGGAGNFDHVEFTRCRAFSSESVLSFETEPAPGVSAAPAVSSSSSAPPVSPSLPALLRVTVEVTTPVSNADQVGKLIEGRMVGNVSYKGKIVVPDGAVVRGRIRRLEHYQARTTKGAGDSGEFIVGLEFTEVETSSGPVPFYADLLTMDRGLQIQPVLTERVSAGTAKITLPELPGVASFFVKGTSFTIPPGFKTVWRTRGPIRGM